MYDYNFPEQLNQKRLTLLLLSLVIPTETIILQNIYKKKKELEIEDIHSESKYLKPVPKGLCLLLRQIRCLHPGFILYQSDEGEESHPITVEVNPLKKLPLVDWFSAEGAGMVDTLEIEMFTKKLENRYSPLGIDIVNQIFEEYLKHNDISYLGIGYAELNRRWYEPIWNKSPESRYMIEGPQHIDKTLDERQKGFNDMFISGELDDVLYEGSEGNGGAILVRDWTTPSSIYF